MLRLNIYRGYYGNRACRIQIQPMLRLNYSLLLSINRTEYTHSNTTNVKVKPITINALQNAPTNSNTTNVKVKHLLLIDGAVQAIYSNTTNVKVKRVTKLKTCIVI